MLLPPQDPGNIMQDGTGKSCKSWRMERRTCCSMLSSGYSVAAAIMHTKQLWLPVQDGALSILF